VEVVVLRRADRRQVVLQIKSKQAIIVNKR